MRRVRQGSGCVGPGGLAEPGRDHDVRSPGHDHVSAGHVVVDASNVDAALREHLSRHLRPGRRDVNDALDGELTVEEVRFEGEPPRTTLAVVLSSPGRPGCRFGLRVRLWNDRGELRGGGLWPDKAGNQILMELDEILATEGGFAGPCRPGEVTWLAGTYWEFYQ
jgi:hypothetical protein